MMLFLALFFISCNTSDECYSCDSKIDSWVKNNKVKILNFERSDIASYPLPYQKGILAVLSPERKKVLWQEKVNHIQTLKLSNEETKYLKWYAKIFNQIDYSKPAIEKLEKEMYDRTIEGAEKFGWSREFVYQTFILIGDVNLDNVLLERYNSSGGSNCDCYYSISCVGSDRCNPPSEGCTTPNNGDCGIFGWSDCDGVCN